MKLSKLLTGIEYEMLKGSIDIDVNKICYDSREVSLGDVFFCIQGYNVDGHDYIEMALDKGALVIICMKDLDPLPFATVIKVNNTRTAIALASGNYFDHPERKMKMIGVTGTNGKTSTTFMLKGILEAAGFKTGIIGTIANFIGDKKLNTHRTTPEALELYKLFNEMVNEKTDYCIMEVSSHSLSLDRVYGIRFAQAIFTNLTRDHLDFHKTFEAYYRAKMKLFLNSDISIINFDSEYGRKAYEDINGNKYSFAFDESNIKADLVARNIKEDSKESTFDIYYQGNKENIKLGIPGRFNISNALGCIMVAINEGINIKNIKVGLESVIVPGRFEVVKTEQNLDFDIYIDYAHTPDALENILIAINNIKKGKLIVIFGCGGNRDKVKRPMMGEIGTRLSDFAIVTSDNPRKEDPMAIIKDILPGIKKDNYMIIPDRTDAIKKGMEMAKAGDILLIAGKGHEDYQELSDKIIHFDEREIIHDILRSC